MYRVLIVDDEPIHRRGLTNMLRELRPDYHISDAKNGLEALEYLKGNPVDLLITDIQMPVMSGLELIENLRGMSNNIRIIILSVYDYFDYARKAIALGAFDYVLKPVDETMIDEVLKKFEKITQKEMLAREEIEQLKKQVSNASSTYIENKPKCCKADSIIEMCKKYIEEHYMEDISLDTVARAFYFNPSYFSNLFKSHTDINFCEYLYKTRIKNAKRLLQDEKYKIYEISKMVGYQDPKYFNRLFKKECGLTPDEYRRMLGRDNLSKNILQYT